jgi:hypothetical protein
MNPIMAYLGQQENAQPDGIDHFLPNALGLLSRNVNNPVARYMLLNAEEQQRAQMGGGNVPPFEQQMSNENPLLNGSQSAMQIAKRSLALDEEQRNRALGAGLMTFFSNMAKPGYGNGFNGALAAANESFAPAFKSYAEEEGRQQKLNAHLYDQQKKEEMAQAALAQRLGMHQDTLREKKLRREEDSARKREELQWKKLYGDQKLNAMLSKLGFKERQALEQRRLRDEMAERGEILLETSPDKGRGFQKIAQDAMASLPDLHETTEDLNKLERLFKEFPHMSTSFQQILMTDPKDLKDGPSVLKIFTDKILRNEKEREALDEVRKVTADMAVRKILSLKGQRTTDQFRKLLSDTLIKGDVSKGGFDRVAKNIRESVDRAKEYVFYLHDAYRRGVEPKALTYEQWENLGSKNKGAPQTNTNMDIDEQTRLNAQEILARRRGEQK